MAKMYYGNNARKTRILSRNQYKSSVSLGSLPRIKYPKGQNPFLYRRKK